MENPFAQKPRVTIDPPEEEALSRSGYKEIGARGVLAAERAADAQVRVAAAIEALVELLKKREDRR